jgi:hypothetical protein
MKILLLLLAMVMINLFACTTEPVSKESKNVTLLFNAATLLKQTLKENVSQIGDPKSESVDIDRDNSIVHSYEKDNFQMIISYDASTQKPYDIFITTVDQNYPENVNIYYSVAGVSPVDTAYEINILKSMNDLSLVRAISLIPKNKNE